MRNNGGHSEQSEARGLLQQALKLDPGLQPAVGAPDIIMGSSLLSRNTLF